MDSTEFHKYASWCNVNFIFYYAVPVNNYETYKIGMLKKGREKIGTEIYKKQKGVEHPIWEKINELYKQTFLLNN